ncbi:hypothetical protein [Bacillus gobiensis]|uniref:Uncharacterized protein n=1 Tax=Bacillus gobiensis TaxID=1441095 RepID=A0A0M4FQP2_9BACI|nr:hypothetical protein [Bacillus gobiensis]ALC81547.1 hypothetical protein AM592_08000 [Bacillus gobiensis]
MDWLEERKELERQLIDAKQVVMRYEGALKLYRSVTDSEYQQALKDVYTLYTAIHNGNHDAGKPADPYEGMSVSELRSIYDEKAAEYKGGAGSTRQAAELLSIDTRIQALESAEAGGETD